MPQGTSLSETSLRVAGGSRWKWEETAFPAERARRGPRPEASVLGRLGWDDMGGTPVHAGSLVGAWWVGGASSKCSELSQWSTLV